MSDDRMKAAQTEAERIKAFGNSEWAPVIQSNMREAFVEGVRWADGNPQPTTITQEELNMAAIEVVGDRLPARGPRAYDLLHDALIALGIRVEEER